MSKPTRVTLARWAIKHQRDAAHYHNLATHYQCTALNLRVGGMNHAYAMCAAQAHVMAWHYLSQLLERKPQR